MIFGAEKKSGLDDQNIKKLEQNAELLQSKLLQAKMACMYLCSILDEHRLGGPEVFSKFKKIFSGQETFSAVKEEHEP